MKKTKSILALLLAGAMLLTAFVGCSSEEKAPASTPSESGEAAEGEGTAAGEKIFYVNNQSEPGSLHPSLAQGTHDSWALNHMFEGLYEKSPEDGTPIFAVANAVETSEDGLVWTFTMNPDAKWSNGDQVTAADFVASYQFCLDPANASQYASQLYCLVNAEAINAGTMGVEELGAKELEDGRLELTLSKPVPYFPDLLTHYTYYPVHAANQAAHPDWAISPENYISNGAFTLTEWNPKENFVLTKNPHFRRAADVKADGMYFTINEDLATTYQMFQQGELDVLYPLPTAVIQQLKEEGNPEFHIFDDLATYYYVFNTTISPFSNVKVRRALSMGIDRQALVDNVTMGGEVPAYTLTPIGIPDGHGDFATNLGPQFTEDIEAAKALLAEGLAEEGLTIETFKFTILYNTNDTHKKVAEAIQAMWKQNLGIDVSLENAEFQVVIDRRHGADFEVGRAGWIGDYADPMTFVELFASWHEHNDSHWHNDAYDALIITAQSSPDNEVRMEAMKNAEKLLMEEMGVMPIYYYSKPWVIKENITGYFAPVNRYVLLMYADKA
jgi:ABC-type oligopeptide transport system, periplasmic component